MGDMVHAVQLHDMPGTRSRRERMEWRTVHTKPRLRVARVGDVGAFEVVLLRPGRD